MLSLFKQINPVRVIYAGLSGCYIYGAIIADKPMFYGIVAVLYFALALLKK